MSLHRIGRRAAASLLACTAIASGLTVAASPSGATAVHSAAKVTIVLFKHYNAFEKKYDAEMITGFEKLHPNVIVKEDLVPPAEEYTKFATLVAGGDPPNVYVDYDAYGVLARGELDPINYKALGESRAQLESQYISKSLFNDFSVKGTLYGVPEESSNYDAFANKSYYTAAGLSVPTTWNQVCADGPKMLVKSSNGTVKRDEVAFPVNFPAGEILVMNAIADEFGKPLFNSSGTKSNLTSKPVVAAFQMLQNLVYKCQAWVPSLGGTTSTIERTLYGDGSSAMIFDVGSWYTTAPKPQVQKESVVIPYPTDPGHPSVSPDYQYDYTVQKGTANEDVAWQFVGYLKTLGDVAFKLGLYSGLKSLANTSTAKTLPFWNSVWVPTLRKGIYLPSLLNSNQITSLIGNAYASIVYDHANVAQTLASANSQIDPLLNK